MMFKIIVKYITKKNFDNLSTGNYHALLKTVDKNVKHQFLGSSAIGGSRQSKEKLALWFERLFRLFPSIIFKNTTIHVSGWPWKTIVVVEWKAHVSPCKGKAYVNTGIHLITLRWFKAISIHAYENAELVQQACQTMIKQGVSEAGAQQIN